MKIALGSFSILIYVGLEDKIVLTDELVSNSFKSSFLKRPKR